MYKIWLTEYFNIYLNKNKSYDNTKLQIKKT